MQSNLYMQVERVLNHQKHKNLSLNDFQEIPYHIKKELFLNLNSLDLQNMMLQMLQNHKIPFPPIIQAFKIGKSSISAKANTSVITIHTQGRLNCVNEESNESFQIFKNGSIFYGQIENKKPNGDGVFLWQNGESYIGQWLNAQKHGVGQWQGLSGDYYIGQWVNGQQDGLGEHKWNGDVYFGQWKNSVKNGYGIEKFENGDMYIGNYFFGKPQGNGEYRWVNGSVYQGQFLEGLRNGFGKQKGKNGVTYEGEYQNDLKHGKGRAVYQDGRVYLGSFVDDMKDGFGVLEFPNGLKQEGIWKQNHFISDQNTNKQVLKTKEYSNEKKEKPILPSCQPSQMYQTYLNTFDQQTIHQNSQEQKFNNQISVRLHLKQSDSSRGASMSASRASYGKPSTSNRKNASVDLKEVYLNEAQRTIKKQANSFQQQVRAKSNNKNQINKIFVY